MATPDQRIVLVLAEKVSNGDMPFTVAKEMLLSEKRETPAKELLQRLITNLKKKHGITPSGTRHAKTV